MNEEEKRRMHKERRKKQKQRRKQRKKEEAKKARLEDRRRRLAKKEDVVKEKIEGEELVGETRQDKPPVQSSRTQENQAVVEPLPRKHASGVQSRKRTTVRSDPDVEEIPKKVAKPMNTTAAVKEINPMHVTLKAMHLGAGSYGSCHLGSYRGMEVVIKQLKVKELRGETRESAERRVREELIYEARIINKLGDHSGLPLLYGICSKHSPFRIILQFHGEKNCSAAFTIFSALNKALISSIVVWTDILRKVCEAVHHVHNVGFLHNDIKGNNVVLDNKNGTYNPVVIDFGKSLPMTGLKGPKVLRKDQQEKYMRDYPHIAPEIVKGNQGQSVASDIYSLAVMAKFIFKKAKLSPLPDVLKQASHSNPASRPALKDIINLLQS